MASQFHVQRNNFLVLAFQCQFQNWVPGSSPSKLSFLGDLRFYTFCFLRKFCLGPDEIHQTQIIGCFPKCWNGWTEFICQLRENFDDFSSLHVFQIADLIIDIQCFFWLHENSLSCGRLVMDKSP